LVENRVIPHAPTTGPQNLRGPSFLNKSRTLSARQHEASHKRAPLREFVISRCRLRDYLPRQFCLEISVRKGMIRMSQVVKCCLGVALFAMLAPAARADEFKLSNNQKISCSRGLAPGKLNTATCKSYTYIFNVKTSEYFRCQVSLALTRDNKEVINVQTDGGCVKKPRIFDTESSYSFDAAETEPPNTNSFFGTGGYSIWASDNTAQKVRGCIIISSGLGSDISKCLDMTFQ
jgi:hypothetical protein